jgi:hypothetical protein
MTQAERGSTFLMREAIRRHQMSSEVIRGHQAERGSTFLMREAIRCHQTSSEVIRGHQAERGSTFLKHVSQQLLGLGV